MLFVLLGSNFMPRKKVLHEVSMLTKFDDRVRKLIRPFRYHVGISRAGLKGNSV